MERGGDGYVEGNGSGPRWRGETYYSSPTLWHEHPLASMDGEGAARARAERKVSAKVSENFMLSC
ncbi:MAG: hypothetical protein CL912_27710 [Deltaproteobacteria bacterium]|nr:hypothetical protein [Deltaproteobacteria bacterium]|tara:strand:- start:282 stop:476 length:195 start_codon:yes stop_codon:yes gene_type:complete